MAAQSVAVISCWDLVLARQHTHVLDPDRAIIGGLSPVSARAGYFVALLMVWS
jgi:hypothetical protein